MRSLWRPVAAFSKAVSRVCGRAHLHEEERPVILRPGARRPGRKPGGDGADARPRIQPRTQRGGSAGLHQLPRFLFRLLQPVRHAHLAVHRRGGGEVLVGLQAFAGASVELGEAEVAVGDEGAHPARLG